MKNSQPSFRKQLKMANETILDFQFDVVHAADKELFLVSVYKNHRKITFFHMQKKNEHWRIVDAPKVADEFHQIEKMLDLAIKSWELKKD